MNELLELMPHLMGAAAAVTMMMWGWRRVKDMLSYEPMLHSITNPGEWTPTEEEWTTARLRRARTERYRAEHEAWDQLFDPAQAGKCPHCAGPKRRRYR